MTSILVLPEQLQAEMDKPARRDYPRKCRGLLLGQDLENFCHGVLCQPPSANQAFGHRRYEISPRDYRKAEIAGLRSWRLDGEGFLEEEIHHD